MAKNKSKFIEDRPQGVVYSKINISLNDIHSYRILYGVLLSFFRANNWKDDFSPVSIQIVDNLPLLSFVPAFLQLWTLCRYCELTQIKIQDIKKSHDITISSSKSDHTRVMPKISPVDPVQLQTIKDKTKVSVVSYDSYKNSIKEVKAQLGLSFDESILDCTHIFRHLEASFLFNRGVSVPDISYKLGHILDKTTLEYIHKDWKF